MFPSQGVHYQNCRKWMHKEMFYNEDDIINLQYFSEQDLPWPRKMIEKGKNFTLFKGRY